jgi:hypothetical protein
MCRRYISSDTKERIQSRSLFYCGHLVGKAPEEQTEHDIAPQLRRAVEQSEHPIPYHAHQPRKPCSHQY